MYGGIGRPIVPISTPSSTSGRRKSVAFRDRSNSHLRRPSELNNNSFVGGHLKNSSFRGSGGDDDDRMSVGSAGSRKSAMSTGSRRSAKSGLNQVHSQMGKKSPTLKPTIGPGSVTGRSHHSGSHSGDGKSGISAASPSSTFTSSGGSKKDGSGITEAQMRFLDELQYTKHFTRPSERGDSVLYNKRGGSLGSTAAGSPHHHGKVDDAGSRSRLGSASPDGRVNGFITPSRGPGGGGGGKGTGISGELADLYLSGKATADQVAKMNALGRTKYMSPRRLAASAARLSSLATRDENQEILKFRVEAEQNAECTHRPMLSPKILKRKERELKRLEEERERQLAEQRRMDASIAGGLNESKSRIDDNMQNADETEGPAGIPVPEGVFAEDPHYMMQYPEKIAATQLPPEVKPALKLTEMASKKKRSLADLYQWEEERVDRYHLVDADGRPTEGLYGIAQQAKQASFCHSKSSFSNDSIHLPLKRQKSANLSTVYSNLAEYRIMNSAIDPSSMSSASLKMGARKQGHNSFHSFRGTGNFDSPGPRRAVTPTIRRAGAIRARKEAEKQEEEKRRAKTPQYVLMRDDDSAPPATLDTSGTTAAADPSGPPPAEGDTSSSPTPGRTMSMASFVSPQKRRARMNTPRKSQPIFHDGRPETAPKNTPFRQIDLDLVERQQSTILERHAKEAFEDKQRKSYASSRSATFSPKICTKSKVICLQTADRRTNYLEDAVMQAKAKKKAADQRIHEREVDALKDMRIYDKEMKAHEDDSSSSDEASDSGEFVWEDGKIVKKKKEKPGPGKRKKRGPGPDDRCAIDSSWWTEMIRSDTAYRKNRQRKDANEVVPGL